MKVILFGGTGTVGRLVVEQAVEQGHEVTLLTRNRARVGPPDPRVHVVEGDVFDARAIAPVIAGHDAVVVTLGGGNKGRVRARGTTAIIEAMGVRGFVVRHAHDGAVAELAASAAPGTALLNAGDGRSAHPTQGLLDMLTLRQAKGTDFRELKVLIVGDVRHSRVARSDLHALRALGAGEIRVCGPAALLPEDDTLAGCIVTQDFEAALEHVDAVMMLRLQRERMTEGLVDSLEDYHRDYGLTPQRLRRAAPDAVVLHPGPMNRGVEIDDAVADGPQSLILRQVRNGVAVRMAVLEALMGRGDS